MQRNSFLFACITSAASTLLTENSSSLCKKNKKKQKNNQKYNGFDLVICVTYANIIYLKNTLVDPGFANTPNLAYFTPKLFR